MKYILVTGCVISGLGKGIITSSIGTILKGCGLSVTAIKIDPYLNIDAGTFSPFEHGEVFVLDDGGEVDLDLGNYERFLDVTLNHDNNITTGKIYKQVIERERRGDYLGKTVQVVPHITDAIQEWVERVAKKPVYGDSIPQVCVIELGGTIGDIEGMPFIEAFRSFQFRVSRDDFMTILVSLVPEPACTGEQKTKPTQNAVRELRGLGLSPDLIACRSIRVLTREAREKVAHFCHVSPEQVLSVSDCDSLHRVPLLLLSQRIIMLLSQRLNLAHLIQPSQNKEESKGTEVATPDVADSTQFLLTDYSYNELMESSRYFAQWQNLALRQESPLPEVSIALVGKYTRLQDSYLSVSKAIQHAALFCKRKAKLRFIQAEYLEAGTRDIDPVKFHDAWQTLCSSQGLIVPGGFGFRGTQGKIEAINWSRTHEMPFLGVCLGMQLAAIELARNKLGLSDANSAELQDESLNQIVIEMPEYNPITKGGTMRLGKRRTIFTKKESSILWKLYGKPDTIDERHRHRFEINPDYITKLEAEGMQFVGCDVETHQRMEIMELKGHSYFVGCQFHPEYLTRPLKPSPPYLGLILAATHKLGPYLSHDTRSISPSNSLESSDFSSWPLEI